MDDVAATDLALYRSLIISALPQFVGGEFVTLSDGWDSLAIECRGWIFKFPRTVEAEARLRREVALLAFLKPRVTMPLPQMVLHEGQVPFTQHFKLAGSSLEKPEYEALREGQRNALAMRMAQLYTELHAFPLARMQQVGAVGVDPWMSPVEILEEAGPKLPRGYKGYLKRTIQAYRKLRIEGPELVYGYFDGHGWNMAFDHQTGLLNGVFDFADSGFGSRHRDLSYSNWISADLTARIIDRYEELSRFKVDRELVSLYTSVLRFAELARNDLPEQMTLSNVIDWAAEIGAL